MSFKEILKWILIGALIYIGFNASDYLINYYVTVHLEEKDDYIKATGEEIRSLTITNERLIDNSIRYSVLYKIHNNSSQDFIMVHIKAILEDERGDLEVCEHNFLTIKNHGDIEDTLSCRNITFKKYPSVKLKKIYIESAEIEI